MEKTDYLSGRGIKKTRQRAMLLEILEEADAPLTASQIHALYSQKDESAWLSTTYRTLDLFCEKGIVNKLIPMENSSAQYELDRHVHKHYAVCKGCQKVLGIETCPMESLDINTKEGVFHITGHRLEVYGYCDDCYSKH